MARSRLRLIRSRRKIGRFLLTGPALLAGVILVATAPHWLANTVWHGNPIYPLMGHVFPSHPWVPTWKGPTLDTGWQPEGTFVERLLETTKAIFTFSVKPHDWHTFHHDIPVFGFLFTLTLIVIPFARGTKRVWLLATATLMSVFVWYWTYHQDRYLQAILPWMVAVTAATILLVWEENWVARLGVACLVALQAIWGGDIPFFGTHAMIHENPMKRAIDLMSSTFRGDESRFKTHTGHEEVAAILPKNAIVLLHEEYLRLGLRRQFVYDSARWQGGIDYVYLGSP